MSHTGTLIFMMLEKNYNSGGVVSSETAKDALTAVVKLYHDDRYPTMLTLPIHTND